MSDGVKLLRKVQLGRETTQGTHVACTTVWRGPVAFLDDQSEVVYPEEDVGMLTGVDRSYVPKEMGVWAMPSQEATFEQIAHLFDAGIAKATPAQDGSGSGYIYSYTMPTTQYTATDLQTYTIRAGDNADAEKMGYSFVTKITLEGGSGEALMVSAEWQGDKVIQDAFTGGLSLPTVEDIIFLNGKLFIDAVGGSIGSTQITGEYLKATVEIETGWQAKFNADGANLILTGLKNIGSVVTATITMEHATNAIQEKQYKRDRTSRLIQLLFEGTAFTTAGTTYSNKSLVLNLPGSWSEFGPAGDEDGDDILEGVFISRYEPTSGLAPSFIVVNDLSSLP